MKEHTQAELRCFIRYMVSGVLTTAVNISAFYLTRTIFELPLLLANGFAWFVSVFVAWVLARLYVFRSQRHGARAIFLEISIFFFARLASGLLDSALMYVSILILEFHELGMKFIVNGIVIFVNFITSRLIFLGKKGEPDARC